MWEDSIQCSIVAAFYGWYCLEEPCLLPVCVCVCAGVSQSSSPDHQPLSESLNVPVRNQGTILEAVDGPGTLAELGNEREGAWEVGEGGGVGWGRGRVGRRRRTSSVMRTVMWVVTEDNR